MGQLVFTRLFYHHMTGQLHGQDDFKHRLYQYLNGMKWIPVTIEMFSSNSQHQMISKSNLPQEGTNYLSHLFWCCVTDYNLPYSVEFG